MSKPKINIEDYEGWENADCTYTASNGLEYEFEVYRDDYSVAWRCSITGEGNGICHHPAPHATSDGAKSNGRKFVEDAIKSLGRLNK
mgnify:CR=1 FL=1|tara:strand:- start:351 stop:611 length:261 start_codon:yes stop_codon:yes gene_type:complete